MTTEPEKKPEVARYLLVSVSDDGEHEIIFLTSANFTEFNDRVNSYRGRGGVYKLEEKVNP